MVSDAVPALAMAIPLLGEDHHILVIKPLTVLAFEKLKWV
jgi:hypothetical protein